MKRLTQLLMQAQACSDFAKLEKGQGTITQFGYANPQQFQQLVSEGIAQLCVEVDKKRRAYSAKQKCIKLAIKTAEPGTVFFDSNDNVVYFELPAGQISFHIFTTEALLKTIKKCKVICGPHKSITNLVTYLCESTAYKLNHNLRNYSPTNNEYSLPARLIQPA